MKPLENRDCYSSAMQRQLLVSLLENPFLKENFFLTGGTALAVFYLHHRISDDLDLFTRRELSLSDMVFDMKAQFKNRLVRLRENPYHSSLMIDDIKVDLVIDPLAEQGPRPGYELAPDRLLHVDSVSNIASNKLNTLVSRNETKDFVDFFFLSAGTGEKEWEVIYENARSKDAVFDDSPSVAYQIEQNLSFVLDRQALFPKLLKPCSEQELKVFFTTLITWIYKKTRPD